MKYVATFLVLFASYVLLAGYAVQELMLGALVSAALTVILSNYVNYTIDYKFPVRLLVFIFAYVPLFVWQLLLANIDVARRVLSPTIPLNPGFVKITTDTFFLGTSPVITEEQICYIKKNLDLFITSL